MITTTTENGVYITTVICPENCVRDQETGQYTCEVCGGTNGEGGRSQTDEASLAVHAMFEDRITKAVAYMKQKQNV